jgi:hypothetical protein
MPHLGRRWPYSCGDPAPAAGVWSRAAPRGHPARGAEAERVPSQGPQGRIGRIHGLWCRHRPRPPQHPCQRPCLAPGAGGAPRALRPPRWRSAQHDAAWPVAAWTCRAGEGRVESQGWSGAKAEKAEEDFIKLCERAWDNSIALPDVLGHNGSQQGRHGWAILWGKRYRSVVERTRQGVGGVTC